MSGPDRELGAVRAGPASGRAGAGELRRIARSVLATARTLRLAIATARRELGELGSVSPEVWAVVDELSGRLEAELGELERARSLGGGWVAR